jgi:hypothetical protein
MAMIATGVRMRKIELDEYVVATLMRDLVGHDRQPSAYLVYLYLWWMTDQADEGSVEVSLQNLAEGTGLSKRAVQDAIGRLHKRKLVGIKRASITAVPEYSVHRPWVRK